MTLDIQRLEKPRRRGRALIARCPACAEVGDDRKCEHLWIADAGRGGYRCVVDNQGKGGRHNRRIHELVGFHGGAVAPVASPPPSTGKKEHAALNLPWLRPITADDILAIAAVRGWPTTAGIEILSARGLLWYDDIFDYDASGSENGRKWPAWVITDSSRYNAQARRLDGCPWRGIGDKKAKTLPGGDPSWPIGAAEIGAKPLVILCEGQPDFCAAPILARYEGLHLDNVAPVCVCGTGNNISPKAGRFFAGKHVRIAVHDDAAGRKAAWRWARQLESAGASIVDAFDFRGLLRADGQPVEDLADYCTTLATNPPQPPRIFADLFHQFRAAVAHYSAT